MPPRLVKKMNTPTKSRMSPTRVTRNAFLAALAASGFLQKNPIRRYEQSPTSSHIRMNSR